MKLRRARKAKPLREQVYDSLRRALFVGEFVPGDRLTEEGIAERLGVSRTPVREALSVLGQEGILEPRPRGGYIYPSPSLQEIDDVFEVRRLLEPYAARRAVRFCTGQDVERLTALLDDERAATEDTDPSRFFENNLEFRRTLFALCGNDRLYRTIDQFTNVKYFIGSLTLRRPEVRRISIECQARIVEALAARDARAVERAVELDLDEAHRIVLGEVRGQA